MRLFRRPSIVLALLSAFALLGSAVGTMGARSLPDGPRSDSPERREVARIRAHFDSVLTELASGTSVRGSAASTRRAALLQTLRAYRDAGAFPHNYDFPGRAVPYFVDRGTGTLCAVAYLLASTGRRDIVDRVAKSNNNAWVADLSADTALARWLDVNGITLAEAARIQVPYMQPSTPAQVARQNTFMIVAPVALGTATVTTMLNALGNADGHRRSARILGFTSGVLAAGAGGLMMAKGEDGVPRIGAATAAIGGLSIALASRATVRHSAIVAQRREAERARSVQASLSPMIGTGASVAGVTLAIRF